MANTLGVYDPIWYAQRALERLDRALNMPKRMFRAYEAEPRTKGSTIQIRKPGGFTAAAMPISTAQDITPSYVQISLNNWYGVVMAVTDKEMGYTGEQYVNEHIAPAMQALGEQIEASCAALFADVPWVIDADSSNPYKDFTAARAQLGNNFVPDVARTALFNTTLEQRYNETPLFNQAYSSSDGGAQQATGGMGKKWGFEPVVNYSSPSTAPGALVPSGAQTVSGATGVAGSTQIVLTAATSLTGTVKPGDVLTFTGFTQRYAVAANASAASNLITVTLSQPIKVTIPAATVWTIRQSAKAVSLFMQQEAFGLVMAPLSESGNGRGAEVAYATDARSGLALRFRRWYEPKEAANYVGFDALWGVKTLDADRCIRVEN